MFARSEKVATFASAFEKNTFLQSMKLLAEIGIFQKKCNVLEKIFAGLKKIIYLCSPFALQNAEFFQQGSLNYWLYLRERM